MTTAIVHTPIGPREPIDPPIIGTTGTAYGSAVGNPPSLESLEWFEWAQQLLDYRLRECPLRRPTKYYFSQSEGNDANPGTAEEPKQTIAAAQALINAMPAVNNDVALLFKRGDRWTATTGLTLNKRHVTVAAYGDGAKPIFDRFTLRYTSGWTDAGGGVYSRAEANTIAWVRLNSAWLTPLYRASGGGDTYFGTPPAESSGSWYYSAGTLFIKLQGGANPNLATIDAVIANDDIAIDIQAHGCRGHGISTWGWGINPTGTSNQAHGIKTSQGTTDCGVFVDCESYYCSSHAAAHNRTSGAGGISTFYRCKAGLCQYNSSGETIYNSYAQTGGQEAIFWQCEATRGALPSSNWWLDRSRELKGSTVFGHRGSSGTINLAINYQTSSPNVPFACADVGSFSVSHLPSAATLADARAFHVEEDYRNTRSGTSFTFCGTNQARCNGVFIGKTANETYLAGTNVAQHGWCFNCHYDLNLTIYGSGTYAVWNTSGGNDSINLFFNKLIARGSTGTLRLLDRTSSGSTAAAITSNLAWVTGHTTLAPNQGGEAWNKNGYRNFSAQPSTEANGITLASDAVMGLGYEPTGGDNFKNAGVHPGGLAVQYDRLRNARHASTPTCGDIE